MKQFLLNRRNWWLYVDYINMFRHDITLVYCALQPQSGGVLPTAVPTHPLAS